MSSRFQREFEHDRPINRSRRPANAPSEQSDPTQAHIGSVIRRAASNLRSLSAGDVLSLQRTIGNRQVTRLMKASTVARQGRGVEDIGDPGNSAAQSSTVEHLNVAGGLNVGGSLNVGGTLRAGNIVAGTLKTGNLVAPNAGGSSKEPEVVTTKAGGI